MRKTFLITLLSALFFSGCAYYNTFFNAKNSYKKGIEVIRENPDAETLPGGAKQHFENTIEKGWKLIDIYSDKSKWADDALLIIAKSEFHLEKYVQAQQHIEQFLQKYPDSNFFDEANLWYAKILLKLGDIEKANENFRQVVLNSKSAQIRSQASFELGKFAFENENYEQAIQLLQTALKEKIDDEYKALVTFYLAESFYITKDYEAAVEQYRKIENYNPTLDIEYKAKWHLSKVLGLLGKTKESDEILRKMIPAIRFKNFVPVIKNASGENLEKRGDILGAADLYREIIEERKQSPGTAQAAYNLARLYETEFDNLDSAIVYYGKVKQMYAKFDSVEVADQKVKQLGEFKEINDQIIYDSRLVYRLTNEPDFLDSLYTAQYDDSVRIANGDFTVAQMDSIRRASALADSMAFAKQDSIANAIAAKAFGNDSTKVTDLAGRTNTQPKPNTTSPINIPGESTTPNIPTSSPNTNKNSNKNEPEKVKIEKRKLPEIEFDLMNSKYQLAQYYLLKEENYDSAAVKYEAFLNTYEDSILTPKAIYSMIFIYKNSKNANPEKVYELEKQLLANYPKTEFAAQIMKSKGMINEVAKEKSPEEVAKEQFLIAESLYFEGQTSSAIQRYKEIAAMDSTWEIAVKSQYAVAWIYEKEYAMNETALVEYQKIIDRFPRSTQYVAKAKRKVSEPVEIVFTNDTTLVATNDANPDSLNPILANENVDSDISVENVLKEKIRWRNQRNN